MPQPAAPSSRSLESAAAHLEAPELVLCKQSSICLCSSAIGEPASTPTQRARRLCGHTASAIRWFGGVRVYDNYRFMSEQVCGPFHVLYPGIHHLEQPLYPVCPWCNLQFHMTPAVRGSLWRGKRNDYLQPHTHTRTHARTHPRTHARAHTHTHTDTHTHTHTLRTARQERSKKSG